jgi:hypothetical protein
MTDGYGSANKQANLQTPLTIAAVNFEDRDIGPSDLWVGIRALGSRWHRLLLLEWLVLTEAGFFCLVDL